MKHSTLRRALGLCAAAVLVSAPAALAASPTPVSFNGTYSQNFTSMGTTTTAPTGWGVVSESGGNTTFAPSNSYIAGVAPNFTAGTLTTSTTTVSYVTPNGTQDSAGAYNFVNTAADISAGEGTESLGTCPTGNAATILELSMTNSTGSSINAVNLSYDMDRFSTTNGANGVPSGYPNTGVEEYPGYQLFYTLTPSVNSSWVNVSALNPTIDAGTTGAVQVPDSIGITQVGTTGVSLTSAWANGATITFAWLDDNAEASSPDQQIGLNNVVIAAVPEPGSGWLGLVAVGAAFTLLRLRRRQA